MEECIFCHTLTSFRYEGTGEYNQNPICPKCQTEKFTTNFNSGCASEDECSVKLNKE